MFGGRVLGGGRMEHYPHQKLLKIYGLLPPFSCCRSVKLVWFLVLNIVCMLPKNLLYPTLCVCVCVFVCVCRFSHSFGMEDKSITVSASLSFFFHPHLSKTSQVANRAICYLGPIKAYSEMCGAISRRACAGRCCQATPLQRAPRATDSA
jgi:hypothetical protein